jgi:hypothetical protein
METPCACASDQRERQNLNQDQRDKCGSHVPLRVSRIDRERMGIGLCRIGCLMSTREP